MILASDRAIVRELVELGIWKIQVTMRLPDVVATPETQPLKDAMLARQTRDDLHHAPCCPANHYHYGRLVFKRCTCGAQRQFDDSQPKPQPIPEPEVQFEIIA